MVNRRRQAVFRGRCSQAGYVMLGALAATAVGLLLALFAFAAADVGGRVTARDHGGERAQAVAHGALIDVVDRLTWGGLPQLWTGAGETTCDVSGADGGTACVVVAMRDAQDAELSLRAEARAGTATATAGVDVRLVPERFPCGLTVSGDLDCTARLTLEGTGAAVGGDVHGRQQMLFPAGPDGASPADRVHEELWTVAAVHAGGHIYADEGEVHAVGCADPGDTDLCTGLPSARHAAVAADELWPPCRERWVSIEAHVTPGLVPVEGDEIDLASIAAAVAALPAPGPPLSGHIIVLRPRDGELALRGWWPLDDGQPQVTLVVDGDVLIEAAAGGDGRSSGGGADETGVALRGALLVTGKVTVAVPTVVVGSLAARELDVQAPLSLVVTSDWRDSPPPGSLMPVVRDERAGRATERARSGPAQECRRRQRNLRYAAWSARLGCPGDVACDHSALIVDSYETNASHMQSVRVLALSDRPVGGVQGAICLKLRSQPADVSAGMAKGRGIRGV